jgi:hypothetical protein
MRERDKVAGHTRFFGRAGDSMKALGRILVTALLVGVVGYQGPMLGIFITGPLGFLVGLGIGCAREMRRT